MHSNPIMNFQRALKEFFPWNPCAKEHSKNHTLFREELEKNEICFTQFCPNWAPVYHLK